MSDETTLAQVFSKAPPFNEAELKLVIAKMRESREQFNLQGKVTKEKAAKAPKVPKSKSPVDLSSIEL